MNYKDYFKKRTVIELYGKDIIKELERQRETWDNMSGNLEYPYYVVFLIFKNNDDWNFADEVNKISQLMVFCGYIPTNTAKHFIPVYGGHEVDDFKPGVVFYVKLEKGYLLCK